MFFSQKFSGNCPKQSGNILCVVSLLLVFRFFTLSLDSSNYIFPLIGIYSVHKSCDILIL